MKRKGLILSLLFLAIGSPARTIYVATIGSDSSGSGSSSSPYATLGKGIAQCIGGDTVFIRAGAYNEGGVVVDAARSGTSDHPTVIMGESRDNVVFDAIWTQDFFLKICSADHIVVKNMSIRRYRPWHANRGALQINSDCGSTADTCEGNVFEDIRVDSSGAVGMTLRKSKNSTLRRVETRWCFQNGFLSIDNNGVQVIGCRALNNNPGYPEVPWLKYYPNRTDSTAFLGDEGVTGWGIVGLDPNDNLYRSLSVFSAGGWKALTTDNVVMDDFDGSENYGPGMWFDTENHYITIRNSQFNGNHPIYHKRWDVFSGGDGFMFESNSELNALIEYCVAKENESESCQLAESKGITIRNCHLYGRMLFRDGGAWGRPRPECKDWTFENNDFINAWINGWATWPGDTVAARNIVFQNNRWQGEEPYLQFNDWYSPEDPIFELHVYGLENMKNAWDTFLGDTYSSEITAVRPVTRTVIRGGNEAVDMMSVFDLRGRFIGRLAVGAQAAPHSALAQSWSCGAYLLRNDGIVLKIGQ